MSYPTWLLWLCGTLLPLALLYLLWRLALRPERCYRYNRALLLLAPVLAAALPLLPYPALPAWLVGTPTVAGGPVVLLPAVGAIGPAAPAAWSGWPWLLALYAAGVSLGLVRLAWQMGRLWQVARRLPRLEYEDYALVHTGGQLPTSTFGRVVFWDETAGLAPAEAQAVLAHELAHVRQRHTRDVLWLELWRIVLWPNPFAHLLLPALRLTHELLADAEAAAATPGEPYAPLLARLAARRLASPAYSLLQPFAFSSTLTRLAMLQNQVPVRRWKQWLVLPVLGSLFVIACQTSPALAQVVPSLTNPAMPPPPLPPTLTDLPELPSGGGQQALLWAISKGLTYPSGQQQQGQVDVEFTVGTDGRVRDARIVRSLAPAYDAAVLTAVRQLPVLKPARQNGQPVQQTITVPLEFAASPARWRPAGANNPTP